MSGNAESGRLYSIPLCWKLMSCSRSVLAMYQIDIDTPLERLEVTFRCDHRAFLL